MASPSKHNLLIFLFCATLVFQGVLGSRTLVLLPHQNSATQKGLYLHQHASNLIMRRRSMIGSVKPSCTYNECRGCKSKSRCSAKQVPVEGNDPINSAYHYRCICHR
ncbi:hypothetical protein QVD17_02754 [Tagetes erecta]|uniref:Stomagen C-terminal domain-containing protein n=1 Tax=Tagetes erecta TaxID=13708 RepID=A0AAD8L766_TARER|nr:hypothetical protein QVD17_02754 [Tagetes erecta]